MYLEIAMNTSWVSKVKTVTLQNNPGVKKVKRECNISASNSECVVKTEDNYCYLENGIATQTTVFKSKTSNTFNAVGSAGNDLYLRICAARECFEVGLKKTLLSVKMPQSIIKKRKLHTRGKKARC